MTEHYFSEEEFTSQFNGKTVLRIFKQLIPHWRWLAGFLVAIITVAFLDAYFTYLGKQIIDQGIMHQDRQRLTQIVLLYGGLIIFQAFGAFSFIYLTGILGERVQYDIRKKLFNKLQELSLSYYSRTPVGWIISRLTSDTERVSDLITWGLLDITWGTVSIISSAYFMYRINWQLASLVLLIIPVLIWVAIEFRKRILKEYRNVRRINSQITGSYNEMIQGVKIIKSLGREKKNLDEFKTLTDEMYSSSYHAAWLSAIFLPIVKIISAFAIGAIAWYGGLQSEYGVFTIGGIQAFISYVTFMLWPIQDLARVYAEMQHSIASAERLFSLMDANPEIVDSIDSADFDSLSGDIEFRNVTFYYEEKREILKNFNLKINRGSTIALVGPTGGGKTTIANLLCRFYEPKSGTILINNIDYTKIKLHSLQSKIGIVLQTPHLFSGTIRENIRYGRLNATDAEIEEASKLSYADEFIKTLPNGYDEDVGEGGNLLSTGQKQLISLARAVLSEPEIFIMDEATSSVDTLTESLIQKGMELLMRDRTSMVIAHRLSTIKNADTIIYIHDGKIAEMGNHTELLRKHGLYYKLYTTQFRKVLEQEYSSDNSNLKTLPNPAI